MNSDDLIELEIIDLKYTHKFGKWLKYINSKYRLYHLVFQEKGNSNHRFKVIIGQIAAESIAVVWENVIIAKPMLIDLFKSLADELELKLDYVLISDFDLDGFFHSKILYSTNEKKIEINAMLSNSIAIAVRHKAPIFIGKEILKKVLCN
jgi:bifunctional DNase/RNase